MGRPSPDFARRSRSGSPASIPRTAHIRSVWLGYVGAIRFDGTKKGPHGSRYPSGSGRLAGGTDVAEAVTLELALRSRRDGWEGSRYRAPTALEQGREGADCRRDTDAGSRGERDRSTARGGAEPALHMAKAGAHRGTIHDGRLDFASG